jgi:hypothetical protein
MSYVELPLSGCLSTMYLIFLLSTINMTQKIVNCNDVVRTGRLGGDPCHHRWHPASPASRPPPLPNGGDDPLRALKKVSRSSSPPPLPSSPLLFPLRTSNYRQLGRPPASLGAQIQGSKAWIRPPLARIWRAVG